MITELLNVWKVRDINFSDSLGVLAGHVLVSINCVKLNYTTNTTNYCSQFDRHLVFIIKLFQGYQIQISVCFMFFFL